MRAPSLLAALLLAAFATAAAGAPAAGAAPRPRDERPARATIPRVTIGAATAVAADSAVADSTEAEAPPRTYEATIRRFATMMPSDSMGNGDFGAAEALFHQGKFDAAIGAYREFARRYPRNLNVNDALSTILLVKDARDFEDRPLLLYARARAHRAAGRPDSAAVLLREAAERYPGAKARYHVMLLLAEIAHDRADHAAALRWSVAAADTAAKNRVAPFALRLAAESSLALGEPPQRALGYYKTILERYPRSAVTPEARARALEIRKRMPQ